MSTIICPSCGHSIPATSTFCPDCGFNLINLSSQQSESRSNLGSRQQRRSTDSWARKLIPNLLHLKQVGRFIIDNAWFLLVVYAATLVFNDWRWEIFVLYLLTNYLFPLLSGRAAFFGTGPLTNVPVHLLAGPRETEQQSDTQPFANQQQPFSQQPIDSNGWQSDANDEPSVEQVQPRPEAKQKTHRFHLMSNLEFRLGTILIIPSLFCYLVAKQVLNSHGIQATQLMTRGGMGSTADVYLIGLGLLGISVAMVLGGGVKGLTHHRLGGQRFKRWGMTLAVITIAIAVFMYQSLTGTTTESLNSFHTIGNYLIHFLPWAAVILYGVGIVKNLITPQRW